MAGRGGRGAGPTQTPPLRTAIGARGAAPPLRPRPPGTDSEGAGPSWDDAGGRGLSGRGHGYGAPSGFLRYGARGRYGALRCSCGVSQCCCRVSVCYEAMGCYGVSGDCRHFGCYGAHGCYRVSQCCCRAMGCYGVSGDCRCFGCYGALRCRYGVSQCCCRVSVCYEAMDYHRVMGCYGVSEGYGACECCRHFGCYRAPGCSEVPECCYRVSGYHKAQEGCRMLWVCRLGGWGAGGYRVSGGCGETGGCRML